MGGNSAVADDKLVCDLGIGQTLCHQQQHLDFAGGQASGIDSDTPADIWR